MKIALLCALVGCAYEPGSFHYTQDFAGQRATVGCIDIAIERRADLSMGPVLAYQFANRCDHQAVVDLGGVAVLGRNDQGIDVALRPFDPHGELHPAALDGRAVGAEALAYPSPQFVPQLCADVALIGHQQPARWLCFGATSQATTSQATTSQAATSQATTGGAP